MSHNHDEQDDHDDGDCIPQAEVPEGAAVFPLIPEELGVHPMLLAVLHAVVFLDGSDEGVVNDSAANEALNYLAAYLQRLSGAELKRVREDMEVLQDFARKESWPQEEITFLRTFLYEFGVGPDEDKPKGRKNLA
ncbi:MAG: hypothetical protein U0744_07090 [Gemmataceae bacterium]